MRTPRPTASRTVIAPLVLALALVVLAGCNTVKGVGRDIEAAGEKGQDVIQGD